MRCPACVATNTPHTLHEDRKKVEGKVERFWDEQNRKHVHDHSAYMMILTCSNGHAYAQNLMGICPVKECDWNLKPEVMAQNEPIGGAQ